MRYQRPVTTAALAVCTFAFAGANCGKEAQPALELSRDQCVAVRRAEEFIAKHGYTDAPAPADPREEPALFDELLPRDLVIATRRGLLKPHAYGVFAGTLDSPQQGWTVVFEYAPRLAPYETDTTDEPQLTGSAVLVSPDGIRLEHMDVKLAAVELRFTDPEVVAQACAPFRQARPQPRSEP